MNKRGDNDGCVNSLDTVHQFNEPQNWRDGYNFTLFRNQFPYIWESFCVGVRKILPIYMGKAEH